MFAGIVTAATASTASTLGAGSFRSALLRIPATASTASGTVMPSNACSGVALSSVADSTYTSTAASGHTRVVTSRNERGRRRYPSAAGSASGASASAIDQNEN